MYTYDLPIGDQCWFVQNLEATEYLNGDAIQNLQDNTEWTATSLGDIGAWCDYNNNDGYVHAYGKLYNWYAVNDARGHGVFQQTGNGLSCRIFLEGSRSKLPRRMFLTGMEREWVFCPSWWLP